MCEPTSRIDRFKAWCAHAFAVQTPENSITPEEITLAERAAAFVVRRRMTAPALLILETGRPFTFIGSQFLTFLSPFLSLIFSPGQYEQFVRFLEKRQSVDLMVDQITAQEQRHRE